MVIFFTLNLGRACYSYVVHSNITWEDRLEAIALILSHSLLGKNLKVRSADFDHFLQVASKEISNLESTSNSSDSSKNKISFLFLIFLFKRVQWNWWWHMVFKKVKTGWYLVCRRKCMGCFYHSWKKSSCNQYFCFEHSFGTTLFLCAS